MNMTTNIPVEVRATWQVPSFDTSLWLGKQHPWCVVIPVINEGDRIKNLLDKMAFLHVSDVADIIIVDGGSIDGSLELNTLRSAGVTGLLVKTAPGKLSAQLRCAYAFALDQGYEGIVTIDGNDKDDPEAIPRFINALKEGVDFVQASRFVEGGVAENTPKSRDFAIRFIHAPALSLSSGFPWTDTTQGFRAYSRRMLADPKINIFRNVFAEYELLAYLSHCAPQLGYSCLELASTRCYPVGEVPTKISAVSGNLKVLRTLFFACIGRYNESGAARAVGVSRLIGIVALAGFVFSVLCFYPGWMSPDSFVQYGDARAGQYQDWHPVLMAWWWGKLNSIYDGPALILLQNILMYWTAWALVALALRSWLGRISCFIPMLGFWPGLLFPLGQIWKDVSFACSLFLAWTMLLYVYAGARRLRALEKVAITMLAVFAFGVKPNGVVCLPFLFFFWAVVQRNPRSTFWRKIVGSLGATIAVVGIAATIVPAAKITKTNSFQYTQTYDLLALSVRTDQVLLPPYVLEHIGEAQHNLESLYGPGGNNALYYNVSGNITTADKHQLEDLRQRWWQGVMSHPGQYISHRLDNFRSLLRWNEASAAYVANPVIDKNPFGFVFQANNFSNWLFAETRNHPRIFFPWIYIALMLVASGHLLASRFSVPFVVCLSGSAFAFILPHLVIAPSSDYRYLYYAYFCALLLVGLSTVVLWRQGIGRRCPPINAGFGPARLSSVSGLHGS